jgi:ferredoxin
MSGDLSGDEQKFEVRIEPAGPAFGASQGRPLLLSAADAGLDMPSSCRNGTCRTCMRRLRSGRVAYRIEWPGLLAEEKAEGWILPCVAYPQSDLVMEG